ncbi:MAG: fibronectin type III domain-containing protein, partial [Acidimicrobiales bacterium]
MVDLQGSGGWKLYGRSLEARLRRVFTLCATAAVVAASVVVASIVWSPGAAHASSLPSFVQEAGNHGPSQASISVTPSSLIGAGNRLIVEVGIWSGANATTSSVADSAGNTYAEVTHFAAPDGTEMSIWTAQITQGGGTTPTITAKPTRTADMGIVALEYSGLSSVAGTGSVDRSAHASGVTTSAGIVSSGATLPTTNANEMAVGFYADSGFGDALSAGSGFTPRANVSPTGDIEMLAEDQPVQTGATPGASAGTGAGTDWLMATVVFQGSQQTVPGAPTNVVATATNGGATVNWSAPPSGNSPITSYTITPYVGATAQTPTVISGNPPLTTATISGLTNGT